MVDTPRRDSRVHAAAREIEDGADRVTPPAADLIEHLEQLFGSDEVKVGLGLDGAVDAVLNVAKVQGRREVLDALKELSTRPLR